MPDDVVDVVVEITDPLADRAQCDVETYAYHVALVSKDDVPCGGSWRMVTADGETLAEMQPYS